MAKWIVGSVVAVLLFVMLLVMLPILLVVTMAGAASASCSADPATAAAEYLPASQGQAANAEYIWGVLRDTGLTAQATAGVMGNLQQEVTTFDPTAVEGNGAGPGTGIAQWGNNGGAHGSNRWNEKLVPWAKKHKLNEWELSTQVGFLIFESKSFPSPAGRKGGNLFEYLRTETNLTNARQNFQTIFEGCGDCHTDTRQQYAEAIYRQFNAKPVTAGVLPAAQQTPTLQAPALSPSLLGKTAPPLAGELRDNTGMYYSDGTAHFAADYDAAIGTKAYAVADGVIVDMGDGVSNDGDHGSGAPSNWITLGVMFKGRKATVYYQHLSPGVTKFVRKGMQVKAGDLIANTGNSGHSTGPHLHLATEWGWKTGANRYDYLNNGPNGPDLIFPPAQVWGAGGAVFNDAAAGADLGGDFGGDACEDTAGLSTTPGQTDVAPDQCPTAAPAGMLRDGSAQVGVARLCQQAVRAARTPEAARAIMFAFANLGKPYGGDIRATTGFDCSSLIARAFVAGGVKEFFSALPSTVGYANPPRFLQRTKTPQSGDIGIMWRAGGSIAGSGGQAGHAYMYLDGGWMIQSGGGSDSRVNVSKTPTWGGWEQTQFAYLPAAAAA